MDVELVAIGVVSRPHGVRGMIKISPYFQLEPMLGSFHRFWLKKGEKAREFSVEGFRQGGRFAFLKLKGLEDAEAVDEYRGWEVSIPRQELPPLPEGQYYTFQIIGSTVITEDGRKVGLVKSVLPMPAHDVYVVQAEREEVMIPAVKEIVTQIDIKKNRVIIRALPGLLDRE